MNNPGKNEDLKDPYTFDSQDENDGENFQVFTLVNILQKICTKNSPVGIYRRFL